MTVPRIKVRGLARYPAAVEATAPITADLVNGTLQVGYDASPLADGAPVDPDTARVVFREGAVYKEATVSDILASTPKMPAQTLKGNALTSAAAVANVGFASVANAIGLGIARATITSLSIPVNAITVAGYSTVGDFGAGAVYVRGSSTGLMAIQDAGGNWWNLALPGFAWAGWFGATGDGATNDTLALQAANDAVKALGGGFVMLRPGVYAISQLVLGSGVIVQGQGFLPGTLYGLYNGVATGPVVEWENARNFQNARVASAVSLTSGVAGNVTLRNVTGFSAGDTVLFCSPSGFYASTYTQATVNSVNAGTKVLNVTPTASVSLGIGDICWDCSNPGPQYAGLVNLYVKGSRGLVVGLQNICLPQTRTGAGALTINGTAAGWSDNRARAPFLMNARVRIESTADDTARTITLRGYALKQDGTRVYQTETLSGPGGGSGKPRYSTLLYQEIPTTTDPGDGALPGVAIDNTPAGNISLGFCGGGDGAGVLTWGVGPILKNVFSQYTRGWAYEIDWIYSAIGWVPNPLASQLGEISYIQGYLCDGGGLNVNVSVDGDIAHVTFNQVENQCIRLGRAAPGVCVRDGHLSGAFESSIRFERPFEGLYCEADTAKISQLAIEGASRGNLVLLGNNAMVEGARVFDPLSSPDAGSSPWVANPDNTSPYTALGIVFGSTTLGFATTKCQVRARTNDVAGGHVVFTNDGGENVVDVDARDRYTALTALATGGVTTVLSVAAIPPKIRNGQTIYIQLDSGGWDAKVIQSINTGALTITLTAPVSGNAAVGRAVVKGLAIGGSLKTTGGVDFLSRVRIDGQGTNNPAYRWNWLATQTTVPADPLTGNALFIAGRPSDGQGALIFHDGSGAGGLSGTTRATIVADSLAARLIAASGLGAQVRVNATTDAMSWDTAGNSRSHGRLGTKTPTTVNASTATLAASDSDVIVTYAAGTCTLTLPAAATYPGQVINVKTTQAQTTVSASSNVVPRNGTVAGTAILAAAAGNWATLKSDGTNWVIMQGS